MGRFNCIKIVTACTVVCVLLMLLLINGCTVLPPAPFPDISTCAEDDFDCIYKKMDADRFEVAQEIGVHQVKWMEGYEPVSLVELNELGALEVVRMSDPFILLGVFGAANMTPAPTGDMKHCKVWYTTKWSLLHELRHCQGFWERRPYLWYPSNYTDKQQEIMKKEGVNSWVETEFYKNEDDKYHWIRKE